MEGDMETEMKHFNHHHPHPLILKEKHHAEGDVVCHLCEKEILCKTSVYTCQVEDCASFFLHKKCADFPVRFMHPNHTHLLQLLSVVPFPYWTYCAVCHNRIYWYDGYDCDACNFKICLKCSVTAIQGTTIQHWSHKHSPLLFVERCSTFKCDACDTVAADSSYRCDDKTCPFWIHQSCATLPQTKLFRIHHKHPLNISDSLPQMYREFTQFCKICCKQVHQNQWLYYCANCRFFAHISCALSTTPLSRGDFDDPKLMHLPTSDERSMSFLMQKCIKDMISVSMEITAAPPNHINHPAHGQHPLALNTKSVVPTTYDGLNQEPERLIICDGCIKPIFPSLDDSEVFYECSTCKFFLHRYCAQFPNQMNHRLFGMLKGFQSSDIRRCYNCKVYTNGLTFESNYGVLDLCCAYLPEKIMHMAHRHTLKQYINNKLEICKACCTFLYFKEIMFGCETCDEYFIHQRCAVNPATVNHRWDPHPLSLVFSLEDHVEDHPHDLECEFCSKEINTNGWFYHCSICDLSFHMYCIHPYRYYSNVKFGATGIKIKAHEHDLTFVQSKEKRRPCGRCRKDTKGHAILECKPCNFTLHSPDSCCGPSCCRTSTSLPCFKHM